MTKAHHDSQKLRNAVRDYFVTWTIGNVVGLLFLACWVLGYIKIHGYLTMMRAVWRGQVIIVANHPSLIEPVLIEAMTWPAYLVFRRYFIWSMPDDALFPAKLRWLYKVGRCIVVDRSEVDKKRNRAALRKVVRILQECNTISIHPEGGRTRKSEQRGVNLLTHGDRSLGEVKLEVIALAKASKASFLPLWIEMSPEREEILFENFSLKGLFPRDLGPIVLRFEHQPYQIEHPFDVMREKHKLERLLLNA